MLLLYVRHHRLVITALVFAKTAGECSFIVCLVKVLEQFRSGSKGAGTVATFKSHIGCHLE